MLSAALLVMVEPRAQNLDSSSQEATWHSNDPQVCLTMLPENSRSRNQGRTSEQLPGPGGHTWHHGHRSEACRPSLLTHLYVTTRKNLSSSAYGAQPRGCWACPLAGPTSTPKGPAGLAERSEMSSGFLLQRKESLMPRQTGAVH